MPPTPHHPSPHHPSHVGLLGTAELEASRPLSRSYRLLLGFGSYPSSGSLHPPRYFSETGCRQTNRYLRLACFSITRHEMKVLRLHCPFCPASRHLGTRILPLLPRMERGLFIPFVLLPRMAHGLFVISLYPPNVSVRCAKGQRLSWTTRPGSPGRTPSLRDTTGAETGHVFGGDPNGGRTKRIIGSWYQDPPTGHQLRPVRVQQPSTNSLLEGPGR